MKKYLKELVRNMDIRGDWHTMVGEARAAKTVGGKVHAFQRGAINIGGTMMLGIAMVFISIGFIFLPITTTASTSLMDYIYSGNVSTTASDFTGYTSVVGITPLLILVGFLTAGVVSGMMGIKIMKGGASGSTNPGALMLLGLSIVFVGIGLIIEPVALDGIASVYSSGPYTDFTGYDSILQISPMLLHLGFLSGAVLTGFFGLKKLGGGGGD